MANDEAANAERLRRFWDAALEEQAVSPQGLDPGLTDLIGRLQAIDREDTTLSPNALFVQRLEETLMDRPLTVSRRLFAAVPPPRTNGHRPAVPLPDTSIPEASGWRSSIVAGLGVAAVILLVLIGGLIVARLAPRTGDDPPSLAAVQAGTPVEASDVPGADACRVIPRTAAQHLVTGTPTTEAVLEASVSWPATNGLSVPAMREADLPRGELADTTTRTGVEATIRELVACRNGGDFARMDALYTDDSFRRAYGHQEASPPPGTPGADAPSTLIAVPEVLETRALTDGRVGVLLAHDVIGYGLREFLILARDNDRWLVDEEVLIAGPEPSTRGTASPAADTLEVTIQMRDFAFEPASVTVPAGRPVTIRLINVGAVAHSFAIDALDVEVYLVPGETTTVMVDAPPGTYEFVSDIPGQRAAGMVGTLTIGEVATPSAV